LSKKVSTERIDGAAALVNAVDRMTRNHTMPATLLAEWV
jgi:phage terminase large subunit-like protein